jgi:hypothetical protein
MSQPSSPSTGKNDLMDVQSALLELHEGLMSLKASLLELAQSHEDEMSLHTARVESDALMRRLRSQA